MTVQTGLGIVSTLVGNLQLIDGIVVDVGDGIVLSLFAFYCFGLFCDRSSQTTVGQTHEDSVEPNLIGIDGLVPENLVGNGARLVFQLFHHGLHGQQVLGLGPFLIHTSHKVTCADIVKIVVEDIVARDVTFLVNHLVGVHLAVLTDVLTTIAQIGVKHAFQFNTHHIAPFRFLGKIEHVALGHTLHF